MLLVSIAYATWLAYSTSSAAARLSDLMVMAFAKVVMAR